jgi:hypothetical protein
MRVTKILVNVSRGDTRAAEYVQRADSTPMLMTSSRKLALLMDRFTAEDAIKSLQTPCAAPNWSPYW